MTRLAFVGPEGTYSHRASLEVAADERLPARNIRGVFDAIAKGLADRGIVPAENVFEGPVHDTLDLLVSRGVLVTGEIVVAIDHLLLGHPGSPPERVYSHPQALAQCAAWLEAELPKAELVECVSTGEAAALAVSDPRGAAIAGGRRAGLEVLATSLAPADNQTRFYVLGGPLPGPTGADRTFVAFAAPHRPGALHACLEPFARAGLNLTRIESRPSRDKAWNYHFLVELEGHPDDPRVAATLHAVQLLSGTFRLLGAWAAP